MNDTLINLKSNFFHSLCLLFILSLPFSIMLNSVIIIMMTILTFREYFIQNNKNRHFLLLIPLVYFVIQLLGLINSKNLNNGIFEIEKILSFAIFPFVFYRRNITENQLENLLKTFVITCFLICCSVPFVYIKSFSVEPTLHKIFENGDYLSKIIFCLRYRFYVHPTYISYYLIFAISICLNTVVEKEKIITKFLYFFFIIVFIIFIILFEARIAIIISLFMFCYFVYLKFNLKKLSVIFILIVISVFVVYFKNTNSAKIKELFTTKFELPKSDKYNSTNIRYANWSCAINIISKNTLLGVGTGNVQKQLNDCYSEKNLSSILIKDNYNSHNQYLQNWANNGIINLFVLIILYSIILLIAISKKDIVIFTFSIIFIIGSMTECILNNQKGIVFFAFFYSIFVIRRNLNFKIGNHTNIT